MTHDREEAAKATHLVLRIYDANGNDDPAVYSFMVLDACGSRQEAIEAAKKAAVAHANYGDRKIYIAKITDEVDANLTPSWSIQARE